jgi:hypothetical protein
MELPSDDDGMDETDVRSFVRATLLPGRRKTSTESTSHLVSHLVSPQVGLSLISQVVGC